MSDDADLTQERMEREEEIRRRLREQRANEKPEYHTECAWCDDPTQDGAKFCCKECSKDWHHYEASLKRNGVKRG